MILVNKANGAAMTESVPLDEIECGIIPTLPPGDYAVYNADGGVCWQHRQIGTLWVRYPYIFRIEEPCS